MGLVEYGSDSEDEEQQQSPERKEPSDTPLMKVGKAPPSPEISLKACTEDLEGTAAIPDSEVATRTQETEEIGPIMGPSRPPRTPSPAPQTPNQEQLSPYSLNRATIRSLTFPTSIPDIPPSPPGDEPKEAAAKFDHFRQLKRQGIHFNEKLLRSSALRNPNLLEKLTAFVGINGNEQYRSNLPTEIWDPTGFPEEAFAPKLAKSQQEVLEKRQTQERSGIDFIGASGSAAAPATALQVGQERKGGSSAADRVMAGLDRERKSNTPSADSLKRKDDRKWDDRDKDRVRDRRRDDDPYKKRRRSRTRSRSRSRSRDGYRDRR